MSFKYNPKRSHQWNYGGKNWRLSRSKIELFLECPRCFYLDNKLGVKRPPSFPFTLNSAVDAMLKREFDAVRNKEETHPLIEKFGVDARPVLHEKLEVWRENFKGVEHLHKPTNMLVSGAIDDLWINSKGEYIVVDYKATSRSEPVTTLEGASYHDTYSRQLEIYQWLLRQNGLDVSNIAYWVYCTGNPDDEKFDAQINFDINLISHVGEDSWVEPTLIKIKETLVQDNLPAPSKDCAYCKYTDARKGIELDTVNTVKLVEK